MSHALATFARPHALLTALLLTLAGTAVAATSDTGFRYQSSQGTAVAIHLATDGSPALISFYSEGPNGLRLLENVFTDADGAFTGELRLPAHLQQVAMVIRTEDREGTLILTMTDQPLGYTE